jgi:hypothetical protein
VLKAAETPLPLKSGIASGIARKYEIEAPGGYQTWFLAGSSNKGIRAVPTRGIGIIVTDREAPESSVSVTKIAEVPVYQAMADGKTDAPGIKGPGVLVISNRLTMKSDGRYEWDLSLPQGEADDRAHARFRSAQQVRAEGHPGRVHAHRREAVLACLRAELLDLRARGLRLEQGVVDGAGDLARVEVGAGLQPEAGRPLAHQPSQAVGTAAPGGGVAGAGRLVRAAAHLGEHGPHDAVDEEGVAHRSLGSFR